MSNTGSSPRRGEVWFADLNPTLGHEQAGREQAGRRPILIISADAYNAGQSDMVIALPVTSRMRSLPGRVPILPPEGGLKVSSDILCGHVRAIAQQRLVRRWGNVGAPTLLAAERVLRLLLQL